MKPLRQNLMERLIKTAGFIGTYPAQKITDALYFIGEHSRLNTLAPPLNKGKLTIFFTALIPAVAAVFFLLNRFETPPETAYMGGIFVLACLLWATEALPLFATSLLIIGLEILLIANPAEWQGLGLSFDTPIPYTQFLKPLSDPVIILFLSGFILARATVKSGVDSIIASIMLKPFSGSLPKMLLGIIAITALFSMWMSNTATTAMMLAILVPVAGQLQEQPALQRALYLAVPIAANLGGMGTPIASPPNAVAVGYLSNLGYKIHFGQWVIAVIPVLLIMLFITWRLLMHRFEVKKFAMQFAIAKGKKNQKANYVITIFACTILLWLSEFMHQVPAPVIALIPVVAFTSTGIIDRNDINNLEWSILLLIAGGIALGMGMSITSLDTFIVSLVASNAQYLIPLLLAGMILISNFMSNTAAANLVIPLGIGMMQLNSFAPLGIIAGTLSMALAASMAMVLPVSTPPNALAYASGKLESGDFRWMGIRLAMAGFLLLTLFYSMAELGQQMNLLPDF